MQIQSIEDFDLEKWQGKIKRRSSSRKKLFQKAEDLDDFDMLFNKETKTHSQLYKWLTRDVWEEYKD